MNQYRIYLKSGESFTIELDSLEFDRDYKPGMKAERDGNPVAQFYLNPGEVAAIVPVAILAVSAVESERQPAPMQPANQPQFAPLAQGKARRNQAEDR